MHAVIDVDALAKRIVVRHREAGYLRLELPAEICHTAAIAAIESGLRQVTGVYRVTAQAADRRLSIRYDAHVCGVADVARGLRALLGQLPVPEVPTSAAAAPAAPPALLPPGLSPLLRDVGAKVRGVLGGLRAQVEQLRNPAAAGSAGVAGSLQSKLQPMLANALTEKAVINFLNDLVAFYLIKTHWELISQRWLKDPVKYANAWLTVFYLVFLLVRYRKSIAKAPPRIAAPADIQP